MKTRFSTLDLVCCLADLQKYIGLRVNQVYDIDQKTYLIKLHKTDEKVVILLESGIRIHSTDYEWPKNVAPSGFSMKMRKHLKNKRLEQLKQLGIDRVVDLQFGSGEAACHIFIQLYDKGNIVLTDSELTILYILRHNITNTITRSVKQKYPIEAVRGESNSPSEEMLKSILENATAGDNLKKILNPHFDFGPAVIEHALLGVGLHGGLKLGKDITLDTHLSKLKEAMEDAKNLMDEAASKPMKGYIVQKAEQRPTEDGKVEDFLVNDEFHPFLFRQHSSKPYIEFETFNKAVDAFFSMLESQNIDLKAINQEKAAMKKLENVQRDHDQRLKQLQETQEIDRIKAELITKNQALVDQAIQAIRRALANQMPWPDIENLVKEATAAGEPVASTIKALKLDINHITLELSDPYEDESDDECEDEEEHSVKSKNMSVNVDIDLDLTAFANARKYYDKKRSAAKKEQKTIESHGKAMKSAERKTKQVLKEMKTIVNITKARKVFWFEKFFWFISSENYLVIAGRDMSQNELIVKRYMRAGDIYVHADIHGASSVIIKNPTGEPVPPKTLNEAGVMALSYSAAWKAKILTAAWWVNSDQVSKTAPTGEYVTTGAFIIRGKKNYLPPGNLIMGYSFLFRLEESSIFRHKDERKVRTLDDDFSLLKTKEENKEEDIEIVLSEDDEEEHDGSKETGECKAEFENDLEDIKEEDEEEDGYGNKNEEAAGKDDEISGEKDEDEEEENEIEGAAAVFPDREIKIHHPGKGIALEIDSGNKDVEKEEEEVVVYLGDNKPVKMKINAKGKGQKGKNQNQNKTSQNKGNAKVKEEPPKPEVKSKKNLRGKMKKIKEKYKDQDEEDRQLYREILQNVATRKNRKDKKKEASDDKAEKKQERKPKPEPRVVQERKTDEDPIEQAEVPVNVDLDVLNSLTGIPHSEDELLFAVPVVAPYSSLQNYKYKVKVTPGTGKRGKAAKTAIQLFLRDKTCTQRERDLMKGVKDEDLARNLPGQVKISGPNLHKK